MRITVKLPDNFFLLFRRYKITFKRFFLCRYEHFNPISEEPLSFNTSRFRSTCLSLYRWLYGGSFFPIFYRPCGG